MNEKNYIYLDSAASASNENFAVPDNFANSNATHDAGRDAFSVLEKAREDISKLVGAKRPSEIIFTSGATESNNIAILGIARSVKNRTKVLVCATEHESTLLPAIHLKDEGFQVEIIPVDKFGFVNVEKFEKQCDENTSLVIISFANTEIGTIQNIKELSQIAHKNGAYFHCDCVGSFGWTLIDVQNMEVDSASFSGHKICSPKGIGALYLKTKTPIVPIMFGGNQERGIRPGTQSVALAASFAKASNFAYSNIDLNTKHFQEIYNFIIQEIENIDGVKPTINFENFQNNHLWNILHLTYEKLDSKKLILEYGKRGIIVSGGPACSAESEEPSHVLKAIGINNEKLENVIRISFTSNTTINDVKLFIDATKQILN